MSAAEMKPRISESTGQRINESASQPSTVGEQTLSPSSPLPLSPSPAPSYRLRLTFATAGPLAYVSVLDLGRIWERSLRRAGVPLKYSQGFNPRPRLQFAAPLPTGCEGEAEWLDLWLVEPWEPARLLAALQGQTPVGLTPLSAEPVPESAPALETQIVAAEYRLELYEVEPAAVQSAVEALLAASTLPRERRGKPYDLRPLIEALSVEPSAISDQRSAVSDQPPAISRQPSAGGEQLSLSPSSLSSSAPALPPSSFRLHPSSFVTLLARLTARPGATGRPDELLAALGYADVPRRCTRVRLLLSHAT